MALIGQNQTIVVLVYTYFKKKIKDDGRSRNGIFPPL